MNKAADRKNSFIVRDFRDDDFKSVASIWELTGLGSPLRGDTIDTIRESIEIGGKLLILEENDPGKICGTSWMTFDGRRIHLHHFAILPEYQGQGLSHMLLQESLKFVRKKGCQVKLEVHKSNTKAIELYKKYGFEYLGDYEVYIIRNILSVKE